MARETERAREIERVAQNVTDISSASQLLRFALAGQLERLRTVRDDLSQARIAVAARLGNNPRTAGAILSHALRDGPTAEQLMKLDEIIGVLNPGAIGAGGLSSFASRLSQPYLGRIMAAPPNWTDGLLGFHPENEFEVLTHASALLSSFIAAEKLDMRSVERIRERYGQEMYLLAKRLILISISPPTPHSYDAQMILSGLASYAFEPMRDWLDSAVRYSPLGFRVWRTVSSMVRLSGGGGGDHTEELMDWVQRLVSDSAELRARSLYPGRSLDLELALVVPAGWSPPGNDWVGEALRARARDQHATIRERGTAAMGLWQRAVEQDRDLRKTEADLRELIAEFRHPDSRPDAAAGLRWVAATLEHVIDKQVAVCNEWPDVDEPWFANVQRAADELDRLMIPRHLRAGTKSLFLNMILQNAGVYRRQAIETVVTGGMTNPVTRALGVLLRSEQDEAWLRTRAEFALGYLQRANRWVEEDLTHACLDAYKNLDLAGLAPDQSPQRSRVTEVHASLFAVGDCFGVAGAEDRAKSARDRLATVLSELASADSDRAWALRRPARAAAYMLTVTAQPRDGAKADLSQELLEKFAHHPDEVTARLSRWALGFRFAPDGTVRPLLDAAVYDAFDDSPYGRPWQ